MDDSLLLPDGSSSLLSSLPILYPPSSTLPFPARPHAHRPSPPAIDPDLPPSDFSDTHSLLNSPTEHSRAALPPSALPDGTSVNGGGADGDDDGQDSDAGLDDDAFREKMEREILGPPGEMGREEEKVARRAWELGSRIMRAELAAREADVHPYDPQEGASPSSLLCHGSELDKVLTRAPGHPRWRRCSEQTRPQPTRPRRLRRRPSRRSPGSCARSNTTSGGTAPKRRRLGRRPTPTLSRTSGSGGRRRAGRRARAEGPARAAPWTSSTSARRTRLLGADDTSWRRAQLDTHRLCKPYSALSSCRGRLLGRARTKRVAAPVHALLAVLTACAPGRGPARAPIRAVSR